MTGKTLGFACLWNRRDPRSTWSYTPWQLRAALAESWSIRDVDPSPRGAQRLISKLRYARIEDGRVRSVWAQTPSALSHYESELRKFAGHSGVSAILQMSDYGRVGKRPYFLYQDLSRSLILQRFSQKIELPGEFNGMSMKLLAESAKRQEDIYQGAATVFCMSEWLRSDLVATGVDPARAIVVPPGINVAVGSRAKLTSSGPRSRLLIVGTEPIRKGLKDVLAALPLVREEIREARLTVVGPLSWPIPGEVPPGVDFVGRLSRRGVAEVLAESDLMVMPSMWEGFGMAFAEALVAGVPCVGRDDCAMPEIIEPPKYGRVVGSPGCPLEPAELAGAIVGALRDDAPYHRLLTDQSILADRFSWEGAARAMTAVMENLIV